MGGALASSGGAVDAGSQSLREQIKDAGEIANAQESQILKQSADKEWPSRLTNLMEEDAVLKSLLPLPTHGL